MKIINRNNFIPVVCVVYTVLSVGKIVLEAIAQQRFGDYQGNLLTILLFSFLGTGIISQHYRLAQLPLLLVALLQYGVLTGMVMLFTWGTGFFTDLHPDAYRDMFWSFTIPYIVTAAAYYAALYMEIRKANRLLKQMKEGTR